MTVYFGFIHETKFYETDRLRYKGTIMTREIDAINTISSRLDRFSWLGSDKAIFRCPLCGDSAKDPNKIRGAFVNQGGQFFFHCFNGCQTRSLKNFLYEFDMDTYKALRFNTLREPEENFNVVKKKSVKTAINEMFSDSIFDSLDRLDKLGDDNPGVSYLLSRRIPRNTFDRFYFTDNFNGWLKKVKPDIQVSDKKYAGIVIPLVTIDGTEIGCQCRLIRDNTPLRYKTMMLSEGYTKCYGMDRIDRSKSINVFEGVFDSVYLRNSIASFDGFLSKTVDKLCEEYKMDKKQFVLWYDFERTNDEILKLKQEAIDDGYNVAFVRRIDAKFKDVNDIARKSAQPKRALSDLFGNAKVSSGLRAKMLLTNKDYM